MSQPRDFVALQECNAYLCSCAAQKSRRQRRNVLTHNEIVLFHRSLGAVCLFHSSLRCSTFHTIDTCLPGVQKFLTDNILYKLHLFQTQSNESLMTRDCGQFYYLSHIRVNFDPSSYYTKFISEPNGGKIKRKWTELWYLTVAKTILYFYFYLLYYTFLHIWNLIGIT